jgi:hypothetical protein
MTAGNPIENRTEYFLNTSLERYCYTGLLDVKCLKRTIRVQGRVLDGIKSFMKTSNTRLKQAFSGLMK